MLFVVFCNTMHVSLSLESVRNPELHGPANRLHCRDCLPMEGRFNPTQLSLAFRFSYSFIPEPASKIISAPTLTWCNLVPHIPFLTMLFSPFRFRLRVRWAALSPFYKLSDSSIFTHTRTDAQLFNPVVPPPNGAGASLLPGDAAKFYNFVQFIFKGNRVAYRGK